MNKTWNKLLEFETRDLVERYIKKKHTRSASKRQVIEITSNFIQAREYFRNSKRSDISVKPLLQHYGVASMARGLILSISPQLSEASLKPSHGLETKNWQNHLHQRNFDKLTVAVTNGTFHELQKATNNKSYFKNNSSAVSLSLNFDIPKIGTEIKFSELIETISDLSDEYQSWCEKKLWFFQVQKFDTKNNDYHYHFKRGKYLKHTEELPNVFRDVDYDKIEYRGLFIVASNNTSPQLSQRFYDSFNAGIGELVLTKSIGKNIHLNTLSQLYLLSYCMGMLARYFPSVWMSLSRREKGDGIYPLFIKAMQLIENQFPLTVLEFLTGPYDFEKNCS